jgi:serine/threonine protein kinase
MPVPATTDDLLQLARQSGILEEKDLDAYLRGRPEALPSNPAQSAAVLVRDGLLTGFQAGQILKGKHRGFLIAGKYKLLEHLGTGGMANVFLCEHVSMRRRVALKVLPQAQAQDPGAVERFYREARAVATLDHPNIVRAHDIDRDGKLHFLVMEYVDGSSLQDIVRKKGPLPLDRAAHYIRQAAVGLDAAEHAGLVHRDIKPGNILVDRSGTVKILDMGLARFFRDEGDDITKKFDENCVLGTADYCAPEQALNSHAVDIRVDIYSLGATFYFVLTGRPPFGGGTTAQKIIWHQVKEPTPVRELRPEVPEGLAAIVAKMMAKRVEDRYQTPAEVYEALAPWAPAELAPPSEDEMPKLCPRAQGPGSSDSSMVRRAAASTVIQPRSPSGKSPTSSAEQTVVTPRPGRRDATTAIAAKDGAPGRRPKWLLPAGVGAAGVLILALGAGGVWWALSGRGRPVAAGPQAADTGGRSPRPEVPVHDPSRRASDVTITALGNGRQVHTANYEAVIEADGNLVSLKIGGVEFFKPGVRFGNQVSRGAYVFSEARQCVLSLPHLEQSGNVVTARGDGAAVSHTFEDASIRWTVTNLSDSEMRFYIVFDRGVRAVTDGRDHWAEVPAAVPAGAPPNFQEARDWPTTTWFAGRSRLTLEHGTRIWGQWPTIQDNYQVWELRLRPRETSEASATAGEATTAEQKRVAELARASAPPAAAEGVTVTAGPGGRHVSTPKYEAVVANDGCVTSLKIGGVELLRPGVSISRGGYFHRAKVGTLRMPQTEQPAPNVVTARGDLSAARFEFGADAMTWTLTNNSDGRLNFYLVFSPAVASVTNGAETVATPTVKDWPTTTWLFGKGRLKATGGTRIWGPWPSAVENSQVWDADLAPRETRVVTLQVVDTPDRAAALNLQTPRDYQVFQRRTRAEGTVAVRGTAPAGCDAVEARLSGPSLAGGWQALPPQGRSFGAALAAKAGGWYKLEVRAFRDRKVVAEGTIDHVGVGEVFVIAGQSNSTNCGEERLRTASRMVSSFDGDGWQPADDPQPGTNDHSGGGSPWAPFGDALAEKYKVPIGIASTGRGGSSVADWKADGDLFRWLARRVSALGPQGFRAVLWHQGEADVGTAADEYARALTDIIRASRQAAGWDVPWFVARVSYQSPRAAASESTRAGQKKLWDAKTALEGPDTDTLVGDNRDDDGQGIHFSAKGLRAHGRLWADKVSAHLDTVLGQ